MGSPRTALTGDATTATPKTASAPAICIRTRGKAPRSDGKTTMAFEQRSLDDYIDVAQRIADFREKYPEGTLGAVAQDGMPYKIVQAQGFEKNGDIVNQTFVVVVGAASRHPGDPNPGVGMAWEVFPGRTPYTRGSELQNAETSAWGR